MRDGLPLNDAYEDVRDAKKRGKSDDAKRAALEEEAPDLAALVEEEKMKLNEAHAAMLERRRDADRDRTGETRGGPMRP